MQCMRSFRAVYLLKYLESVSGCGRTIRLLKSALAVTACCLQLAAGLRSLYGCGFTRSFLQMLVARQCLQNSSALPQLGKPWSLSMSKSCSENKNTNFHTVPSSSFAIKAPSWSQPSANASTSSQNSFHARGAVSADSSLLM